jgi:hypothetical protein
MTTAFQTGAAPVWASFADAEAAARAGQAVDIR